MGLYLYRHIRPDYNEVFYVGIGKDKRAWDKRSRTKFWNSIVDKNNGNYKIEIILEDLTEDEANEKEIEFIALYGRRVNNTGTLVNIQAGGKDHSGYKMTKEQKIRLSEILKGNTRASGKWSKERSLQASISRKGRLGPNKGRILSEEVKKRMSEGHKGNLSHTGKICINNGIKNTYILKDNPIPEGWIRGKVKSPNLGRKKKLIN